VSWFENFKQCMKSTYGIDVPDSLAGLYVDAAAAAASFKVVASTVEKFGSETTIGELLGAGLASEIAEFAVAVIAVLGAGAAVGAFLSCGVIDELL
jgi:hypothetical protein